jgi:hypothetical protein
MRILVTERGEEVMKKVKEECVLSPNKDINKPSSNYSFMDSVRKVLKHSKNYSVSSNTNLLSPTSENTKIYPIKNKKLSIPKNILERYNREKTLEGNLLPNFNINFYPGRFSNTTSMQSYNLNSMKLKDCLQDETYIKMLDQINQSEEDMKIKNLSFRNYSNKVTKLSEVENCLNKEFDQHTSVNLIKYLNTKEVLSPVIVKKIANYGNSKIIKLNKVCQILNKQKENEILEKEKVIEKLNTFKKKEMLDYKNEIGYIGERVHSFKQILDENKVSYSREDRFRDIYREQVKRWEKYDLNRYFHRRNYSNRTEISSAIMDIPNKSKITNKMMTENVVNSKVINSTNDNLES